MRYSFGMQLFMFLYSLGFIVVFTAIILAIAYIIRSSNGDKSCNCESCSKEDEE